MLITNKKRPSIAKHDINCFKVMLMRNDFFYVCPPAFQYFLSNNIKLNKYRINKLYSTDSMDSNVDYRKDGMIWEWFLHTFCDLKSASNFVSFLQNRIDENKSIQKNWRSYKIPVWSRLVILNAIIPKWSLYYKWNYKEVAMEKTYASNKIIYNSIYKVYD